jgi:DNA-directed RNA polymerase specialized sigma54-like protein
MNDLLAQTNDTRFVGLRFLSFSTAELFQVVRGILADNPCLLEVAPPDSPIGHLPADVVVVNEAGQWRAHFNEHCLPHLGEVPPPPLSTPDDCRRWHTQARELMYYLHRRREMVLDVSEAFVREQSGFFDHGLRALKPMREGDLAKAVGHHGTTVSRAIQNKSIHTPHGVFALRDLFTFGRPTRDGTFVSNETIKYAIARMIAGEDPAAPLNDRMIHENLQQAGILVPRRTVATYRRALQIPRSNQRVRGATFRWNETVGNAIAKLIAGEDPAAPLNDRMIHENLQQAGILVARRTIAKYRRALKIPRANLRK